MASLAATLLLAAPDARAGSYTLTYSSGITNIVTSLHAPGKSNTFPPRPFSTSNGQYSSGGGCQANSNNASNMLCSVKANSPAQPIIATFTWQPAQGQTITTDPPPPAVIVQQNCTASWLLGDYVGTGTASGSADCALPGASVSTSTSSSGATTGMTSSGVQYTVVSSPGASFTVPSQASGPYKPTASTMSTSGSSGVSYSSANVTYQVQAFPVTVNLTGGIGPSTAKHLLIGQQLIATLSSGPLTQTSWSWGASGGEPFKNYVASISSATYTPLGYETSSQLTCYFHNLRLRLQSAVWLTWLSLPDRLLRVDLT